MNSTALKDITSNKDVMLFSFRPIADLTLLSTTQQIHPTVTEFGCLSSCRAICLFSLISEKTKRFLGVTQGYLCCRQWKLNYIMRSFCNETLNT
jgi:hypothetical protein